VGPRAGPNTRDYRKNPLVSAGDRNSIAQSYSPQPDTILTELPGSPQVVTDERISITGTKVSHSLFLNGNS
jgi:hypothetical protein